MRGQEMEWEGRYWAFVCVVTSAVASTACRHGTEVRSTWDLASPSRLRSNGFESMMQSCHTRIRISTPQPRSDSLAHALHASWNPPAANRTPLQPPPNLANQTLLTDPLHEPLRRPPRAQHLHPVLPIARPQRAPRRHRHHRQQARHHQPAGQPCLQRQQSGRQDTSGASELGPAREGERWRAFVGAGVDVYGAGELLLLCVEVGPLNSLLGWAGLGRARRGMYGSLA